MSQKKEHHSLNILRLAEKYRNGTISPSEKAIYDQWYQDFNDEEVVVSGKIAPDLETLSDQLLLRIHEEKNRAPKQKRPIYLIMRYAAAMLILVAGWFVYLQIGHKTSTVTPIIVAMEDILPATEQAILSLDDGRQVLLDTARSGVSLVNGQLVYEDGTHVFGSAQSGSHREQPTQWATLQTPRGSKYQITLADGSKVWLNAATKLRYPIQFSNDRRTIHLVEGEAYLEVTPSSTPFEVQCRDQQLMVLGTAFNINAYPEKRHIITSLVSGRVQLNKGSSTLGNVEKGPVLTPGESFSFDGIRFSSVTLSEETALAWRNGLFYFSNTSLTDVLHELSRWYDIEVQTENLPNQRFNAVLDRSDRLDQVIKMIEITSNLKFKMEGRTLMLRM